MYSHANHSPCGLSGKLISQVVILLLWITGADLFTAFAQSAENSAISRLLPSAAEGHVHSQVELANAYLVTNRPEDLQNALRWYRLAASSGDPFAQTRLGLMLEIGLGTPPDPARAQEWYHRAAADRYPPAMVLLASLYSHGKGVLQDRVEASRLLERAAEQGYAPAKTDLALLYLSPPDAPRGDADALGLLRKAARRDPKAAFLLGWCYQHERGVRRDLARAMKWYRKAANQGFAAAENNIGFLYETGGGVPADGATALGWYRLAAEHGFPDSALTVAKFLLAGPESVRDRNGALVWFEIARRVQARGVESESALDRLTQEMSPSDHKAIDNAASRWLAQYRPGNRTSLFRTPDLPTSDRDDR
jgi:TPR repeat protein